MDIRIKALVIILLLFTPQCNIFSAEKDMNASEYMALLRSASESASGGLPLTPKDDKWGEPNNGFVTQLIPQSKEYILGKPMKFGLVLKNVSDSVKQYDNQGISLTYLIIIDANNNEPFYKKGPFQTEGAQLSIGAGEVVSLFENRNISDEYVIVNPGKYTIQFPGRNSGELPASNIIEFEVKQGIPDERDLLIVSLDDILPDPNWQAIMGPRQNIPAGRKGADGNAIVLSRIRSRIRVLLWLTKTPAQVDEQGEDPQTSDYLGKNASGYFYIVIPPKALDYWPKIKEDIVKTLGLTS